jgi:hypothetical protein
MEHRCGQRVRLDSIVSVTDGSGWSVSARVRDISASGAFLECTAPRATVTRVLVELRDGRRAIALAGDVVRRAHDGIGIEWGDFAPAAVTSLLQGAVPEPLRRRAGTAPRPATSRLRRANRPEGDGSGHRAAHPRNGQPPRS